MKGQELLSKHAGSLFQSNAGSQNITGCQTFAHSICYLSLPPPTPTTTIPCIENLCPLWMPGLRGVTMVEEHQGNSPLGRRRVEVQAHS